MFHAYLHIFHPLVCDGQSLTQHQAAQGDQTQTYGRQDHLGPQTSATFLILKAACHLGFPKHFQSISKCFRLKLHKNR